MSRSYTTLEVNRMRMACLAKRCWETGYSRPVDFAGAEDKLRTYILAGVDPDELWESVKKSDGSVPVLTECGGLVSVDWYQPKPPTERTER